jgi:hypothetical protein
MHSSCVHDYAGIHSANNGTKGVAPALSKTVTQFKEPGSDACRGRFANEPVSRPLAGRDPEVKQFVLAEHGESHAAFDMFAHEKAMQVVCGANLLVVEPHNHIIALQTRGRRCRTGR